MLHRLGFRVTDAPASASAFLPASRPLIPPNGDCHLTANLNAATTKLPHLAKLIPMRRAPFPTASCLVLGPRGPGTSPPSYTTASFNHVSLIVLILSVFNYIFKIIAVCHLCTLWGPQRAAHFGCIFIWAQIPIKDCQKL